MDLPEAQAVRELPQPEGVLQAKISGDRLKRCAWCSSHPIHY